MNKKHSLSDTLNIDDLEKLYFDIVLKQKFYDENYGNYCDEKPYSDMAELLISIFNVAW